MLGDLGIGDLGDQRRLLKPDGVIPVIHQGCELSAVRRVTRSRVVLLVRFLLSGRRYATGLAGATGDSVAFAGSAAVALRGFA